MLGEKYKGQKKQITIHIASHNTAQHKDVRRILNPYLLAMATATNSGDFVERFYAALALFLPHGLKIDKSWIGDMKFLEVRSSRNLSITLVIMSGRRAGGALRI